VKIELRSPLLLGPVILESGTILAEFGYPELIINIGLHK